MGVTQASTEECLKLVPRDWDRSVCVISLLILLPVEADLVLEKGRGKGNPGRTPKSSGSKVVFTLLTEVVAVHLELFAVYIRRAGLQLLLRHLGDGGSWGESGSESLSL